MPKFIVLFSLSIFLICCASPKAALRLPAGFSQEPSVERLDRKIEWMFQKSLPRMICNLSVGSPGSIIASPEAEDPDYYYHWVRDSALVVKSLSRLSTFVAGTEDEVFIRKFVLDFAKFSSELQKSSTPFRTGETRFHVDGSVDRSAWPRPQYDGSALRALALLDFFTRQKDSLTPSERALVLKVLRADLESTARDIRMRGFDLWEYANGFHFFTRMVQLGALEKGMRFYGEKAPRAWLAAAQELRAKLQTHWNAELRILTFDREPFTDSKDQPLKLSRSQYETPVSLAVIHADLDPGAFDDMDQRVWSTLWKQEEYFLKNFPFNKDRAWGPSIGRDPNDGYYGGNAFFFLTAAFAEHRFRTAARLSSDRGEKIANPERAGILRHLAGDLIKENSKFTLPSPELAERFARDGDAFLETMLDVIPDSGMMSEQMHKVDGSPVSAQDLTWSYASLLTAVLQREQWHRSSVDFKKIHLRCPDPALSRPRKKH